MRILYTLLLGSILCVGSSYTASPAMSNEGFYAGKTVRFVVGFTPGGGFDVYTRVIARHIGMHIPGSPSVIVENMPGGGSLIAANHTYNVARPDGLTIGHFHGGLIMRQVFGDKAIKFDARKFNWIGAPAKLEAVCAFSRKSGITDAKRWIAATKKPVVGATAPGSQTYDMPKVLNEVLGVPVEIVTGYKGISDIRTAVERGELDGVCGGWEAMRAGWEEALERGDVIVVIQSSGTPIADLPTALPAIKLAKTKEDELLIRFAIQDISDILRPYALPPGTSAERVTLLRKAFIATTKDPKFLADAKKARLSVEPMPGQELEQTISGFFELEPSLVRKIKQILSP